MNLIPTMTGASMNTNRFSKFAHPKQTEKYGKAKNGIEPKHKVDA
jgi:hypothetical protein